MLQSKEAERTRPDRAEYSLEGLLMERAVMGPLWP